MKNQATAERGREGGKEKWVVVETYPISPHEDLFLCDPVLEKEELAEFGTIEEAEEFAARKRLEGLSVKVASSIDPWRLEHEALMAHIQGEPSGGSRA